MAAAMAVMTTAMTKIVTNSSSSVNPAAFLERFMVSLPYFSGSGTPATRSGRRSNPPPPGPPRRPTPSDTRNQISYHFRQIIDLIKQAGAEDVGDKLLELFDEMLDSEDPDVVAAAKKAKKKT
jgi:hypothetical protein